jgi:hypothetical protein
MAKQMGVNLGGSFTFPNTSVTVNRVGYGAMQLAALRCGDRRAMGRLRLLFCERRLRLAWIISIPVTFTVRM